MRHGKHNPRRGKLENVVSLVPAELGDHFLIRSTGADASEHLLSSNGVGHPNLERLFLRITRVDAVNFDRILVRRTDHGCS